MISPTIQALPKAFLKSILIRAQSLWDVLVSSRLGIFGTKISQYFLETLLLVAKILTSLHASDNTVVEKSFKTFALVTRYSQSPSNASGIYLVLGGVCLQKKVRNNEAISLFSVWCHYHTLWNQSIRLYHSEAYGTIENIYKVILKNYK